MQKALIKKIIHAAIIGCITTANANSIPFIFYEKIAVKHQLNIASFEKTSIAKYVRDNELDLRYVSVGDSDIPIIIKYLRAHPEITSLNLEGIHDFTSEGIAPIAGVATLKKLNLGRVYKDCTGNVCTGGLEAKDALAFANNTTLTSLNLCMNNIGDEGAIALTHNPNLKHLDVTGNNISDAGGLVLAKMKSLESLSLAANEKVSSKTAIALSDNPALRSVELQATNIDDEGVIALASRLPLIELILADNKITNNSAAALAENKTIKKLDIAGTLMTKKGAKILAANKTLTYLDFSGDFFGTPRPNDIRDEGAIALSHINTLTNLYLSSQQISSVGAAELGKLNLATLDLSANYNLGDQGAVGLSNKDWFYLNLTACSLTDKGIEALSKNKFNILDVGFNDISDAGASLIANKVDLILDLTSNNIHDDGAFSLAKKGTMRMLRVSDNYISVIGIAALVNRDFDYLEIGIQHSLDQKNSTLVRSTTSLSNRKFCFRETEKMQCVNREELIRANHA